ncbi:hypothetical protein ABTZ99_05560 [Actinosynnema sp. NPDC002837]
MNVYPFIEAERVGGGNVHRACTLLEVSRSAYYARRTAITTCARCWTSTRPTTTIADHTKPYNSPHHDRTTRSQSRTTPRYAVDQSSAA